MLLEKLRVLTQALTSRGLSTTLPAGVLHRNLENETDQDFGFKLFSCVRFLEEEFDSDRYLQSVKNLQNQLENRR